MQSRGAAGEHMKSERAAGKRVKSRGGGRQTYAIQRQVAGKRKWNPGFLESLGSWRRLPVSAEEARPQGGEEE